MNEEKIEKSRKILRLAADMSLEYYKKPLIVTYSGGKDSDVLLHLAQRFLKPDEFEIMNSHTTVDAPQTVYHIREVFHDLENKGIKATIKYPKLSMWRLIEKKGTPPTRMIRYCCQVLKENSTPSRYVATGVRKDESAARSRREAIEKKGKTKKEAPVYTLEHAEEVYREAHEYPEAYDCRLITSAKQNEDLIANPIIEWTESDVWEYIRAEKIRCNPLYETGYARVGCVGCPLAIKKQREKEFADFPKYKEAYIRAFNRMLEAHPVRKEHDRYLHWKDGRTVFRWWMQDQNVDGQLEFDVDGNIKEME